MVTTKVCDIVLQRFLTISFKEVFDSQCITDVVLPCHTIIARYGCMLDVLVSNCTRIWIVKCLKSEHLATAISICGNICLYVHPFIMHASVIFTSG